MTQLTKMEPNYPITREQLRRYAVVKHEQQKTGFVLKGADFISQTIIRDATPNNGNIYTFRFGVEPLVTCSEIRITELINACCQNYPNVYMAVRDGPFDGLLKLILEHVKERFPDCAFTQDPARKYLFADWS